MRTVHFVYPHRDRISCPNAIGRKVGERLAGRYRVVHYDIDETRAIEPGPDDVLLGHPAFEPWTIFRRSLRKAGWKRKLMLMPYSHGDGIQVAFADPVVRRSDLYLAVTGRTWFESVPDSLFAHWGPKMVHLDLAVDRADFPRVKEGFGAPGRRKLLYVGHTLWFKNTPYLAEIARRLPGVEVGWMGSGEPIPGLVPHGRLDFATEEARRRVAEYDFLITVGSSDPNPATILEAMAWGLVPVCTPESGYAGEPGIVNVPLGDPERAAEILRGLQELPEERLLEMRAANDDALERHYNWDRFTEQIVEAIESDASPACLPVSPGRALAIRRQAARSPHFVLRPRQLKSGARALLASSRAGRALLARRRGLRCS